jgi:hypothetical protein
MLWSGWFFAGCPASSFAPRAPAQKQPFTESEDRAIADFVRANGARNWNFVASELAGRTPKQCRERWHNHLDPSIQKGPWSPDEDQVLAEKQAALGNKWAEIARFLPGRTDTLVKNRWNTSVRARVAVDVGGRIAVLPPHAAQGPLFDAEPAPPPADGGSVVAWLDALAGEARPAQQGRWRDWIPPLLKR